MDRAADLLQHLRRKSGAFRVVPFRSRGLADVHTYDAANVTRTTPLRLLYRLGLVGDHVLVPSLSDGHRGGRRHRSGASSTPRLAQPAAAKALQKRHR